tara:strand:- start:948 stop:1577 length:630 start_codon:yes stop_codon:yes gene_type:complete
MATHTNKYKVTDNFMPNDYLKHIKDKILAPRGFPWDFSDSVAYKQDNEQQDEDAKYNCYLMHEIFNDYAIRSPLHDDLMHLYKELDVRSLIRVRVLMYLNHGKQIIHQPHTDFMYSHKAALIYLNTNDGFTQFADADWMPEPKMDKDPNGELRLYNYNPFWENSMEPFKTEDRVMSVENRLVVHDGSRPHSSSTCTDQTYRVLLSLNYT